MRTINAGDIEKTVSELFLRANTVLRKDIKDALRKALKKEKNELAKLALRILLENAEIAKSKRLPICQDTGMPIVFIEIGEDVKIKGGNFKSALLKGARCAYRRYSFRNSIVIDPLKRYGPFKFGPAILHFDIKKGDRLKITVMAKGFGSENKNCMKMFNPTDDIKRIEDFVVECAKKAGPDACPPYIIGVGIGGTTEKANLLAKEALLRPINKTHKKKDIASMEREILKKINKLGIGPMGFGGKATCLGVNIQTFPTHIAGLPVAVNIGCHAIRTATKRI